MTKTREIKREQLTAPQSHPGREFSLPVRVYYQHTDAGGVVHHAHYLNFMEHARTEWMRALGFGQPDLTQLGVMFAVRTAKLDFLKPARLDDALQVGVRLLHCGGASLVLEQRIGRDDAVLCQAEIKLACLDVKSFSPVLVPEPVLARLAQWEAA